MCLSLDRTGTILQGKRIRSLTQETTMYVHVLYKNTPYSMSLCLQLDKLNSHSWDTTLVIYFSWLEAFPYRASLCLSANPAKLPTRSPQFASKCDWTDAVCCNGELELFGDVDYHNPKMWQMRSLNAQKLLFLWFILSCFIWTRIILVCCVIPHPASSSLARPPPAPTLSLPGPDHVLPNSKICNFLTTLYMKMKNFIFDLSL